VKVDESHPFVTANTDSDILSRSPRGAQNSNEAV
jgi:hypothetical protein